MSFEAKYHGTCTICHGRISPGDICAYDNDQLIHDACLSASEVATYKIVTERPVEICDKCFLTKPCECD